jgi:hypothetical protein
MPRRKKVRRGILIASSGFGRRAASSAGDRVHLFHCLVNGE